MDDELKRLQAELTDIKTKQIQIFDHLENMDRRLVSLEERGKSTIDDSKIIEQSTTKTGAPPVRASEKPILQETAKGTKSTIKQPQQPAGKNKRREQSPAPGMESLIGGTWLSRVGVFSFIFGIAFFIKYASDQGWLTEAGRTIIGGIAGIALLGIGEKIRRNNYTAYAQSLTGGGIAVLYFSVFAAFSFYSLIETSTGYILMILITTLAVFLAVYQNSKAIVVLGLMGGFLTPFLFSSGAEPLTLIPLFVYLIFLNVGILTVFFFKKWVFLGLTAFIPTNIIIIGLIIQQGYPEAPLSSDLQMWSFQFFLAVFFVIFSFYPLLKVFLRKGLMQIEDSVLFALSAACFFGISWINIQPHFPGNMGVFVLMMAAFYLLLGLYLGRYSKNDSQPAFISFTLMALLFAIFIPVQFKGESTQYMITAGWAAQAAVLCYLAVRLNDYRIRGGFWLLVSASLIHLIATDWLLYEMPEKYQLLINSTGLLTIFVVGVLIICAWLFSRLRIREGTEDNRGEIIALSVAACLLFLVYFSIDIYRFYSFLSLTTTGIHDNYTNMYMLSMSVFWAIYASSLMVVGFIKRWAPLRYMAMVLFGITILKVFLLDLSYLDIFYRIISFMVLGIILLAVSFLYQKYLNK